MEERISLPKKTKIAAQGINLLVGLGIAGILTVGIILPLLLEKGFEKIFEKVSPEKYFLGIVLGFIILVFLFYSSLQLMRGKKWAWWVIVIWLSIIIISENIIRRKVEISDLLILIPLILLLLDRKNFWKVAK